MQGDFQHRDVMNPNDLWASDVRKPNRPKSRVGFPVVHMNKRMLNYRAFTIQLVLIVLLVVCITVMRDPFKTRHQTVLNSFIGGGYATKTATENKHKGVIILTNHRSGSTFTGELFNQNDDVFYVFEPLIMAKSGCENEDGKVNMLEKMIRCQFHLISDLQGITPRDYATENCLSHNFCFRQKSKVLCSKQFCTQGDPQSCSRCEPVDPIMASDACGQSKVVVIKVIRMCHLESLRNLVTNPKFDIKIVHLVRDPRGVFQSVSGVSRKSPESEISRTCGQTRDNLEAALSAKWLEGKYKLLRYEDLCRDPLQTTQDLYKFTGLDIKPNIERWVQLNTNGSARSMDARGYRILRKMKKKLRLPIRNAQPIKKLKILKTSSSSRMKRTLFKNDLKTVFLKKLNNDPYTTTRNSTANWWKWTRTLDDHELAYVQHKCSAMMQSLNYNFITNTTLSIDEPDALLEPLCNSVTLGNC
uniref:Sulfotransferase n=1 Tax=Ciona savignyi TaxID=51511 RepID=H2YDE9_CIOSA